MVLNHQHVIANGLLWSYMLLGPSRPSENLVQVKNVYTFQQELSSFAFIVVV